MEVADNVRGFAAMDPGGASYIFVGIAFSAPTITSVGEGVAVGEGVGELEEVAVGVSVGVGDAVEVGVGVSVGVDVVADRMCENMDEVELGVGVRVGVGVGQSNAEVSVG
jgi:hypothetical protein